jgi:glycosyltransferase involved in cell wall biosynthesis
MEKILIIITKGEIGGAQVSVLNLAQELKSRGADITLGFGQGNFLSNELKNSAIPFVQFKQLKRTHNPLSNLLFILEIKRYLNENHFTVIHINSSNALLAGLGAKLSRTKAKTVFTFRGLSLLDKNYQKNRLLKFFYYTYFKLLLYFIDEPVFVCQQNLSTALKIKIVKKGTVIYNGLNPQRLNFLNKESARQNLLSSIQITNFKLQISNFIIGSIGRLCYAKNYEFLINIFPQILKIKKDAVCLIMGQGENEKKYRKLIARLNLSDKIFLLGEIPKAYRYLKAFDLFVLPSRYEGLSITLIEALMAGVPILTTKVGGNPELLNNSPYQLYELDNEKDFLDKLKRIIDDENLRQRLKEDNKQLASKFNLDKTVNKYLAIYQK